MITQVITLYKTVHRRALHPSSFFLILCGFERIREDDFQWRRRGSNPWPSECHSDALPTELRPQKTIYIIKKNGGFVKHFSNARQNRRFSGRTMRRAPAQKPVEYGTRRQVTLLLSAYFLCGLFLRGSAPGRNPLRSSRRGRRMRRHRRMRRKKRRHRKKHRHSWMRRMSDVKNHRSGEDPNCCGSLLSRNEAG